MKKRWLEMKEKWGSLVMGACVVVVFYLALSNLSGVLKAANSVVNVFVPVIIGAFMAFILNPFVKINDKTVFRPIKNRKVSWILSIILAYLCAFAVVIVLLLGLIPSLVESFMSFVENIDRYMVSLGDLISRINVYNNELLQTLQEAINTEGKLVGEAINLIINNAGAIIKQGTSITFSTANVFIGFVLSFYFLGNKNMILEWIKNFFRMILPEKSFNTACVIGNNFNSIFSRFVFCELIDSGIVFLATFMFMTVFGMPYTMVISVIVAVTNLVPTFGPFVGGGIGVFILLLVTPINAVWFLIFTLLLQLLDGYWIKPKLFGNALSISGVVILIAIVVAGRILGVLGIFLSIPAAAMINYLLKDYILPKLAERKKNKEFCE